MHVVGDVAEEGAVSLAEVVVSWVAVAVVDEAVAGTLAVACEEPLTLTALGGEGGLFVHDEGLLAFAVEHLCEGVAVDVAQAVAGIGEVVAAI